MKKLLLITVFLTLSATPAFADLTSRWCPDQDAVCSQQRNKRIIVYDPNGYFRQTTLATTLVPTDVRSSAAARYDRSASGQVYDRRAPRYVRQYYFRPVGSY